MLFCCTIAVDRGATAMRALKGPTAMTALTEKQLPRISWDPLTVLLCEPCVNENHQNRLHNG